MHRRTSICDPFQLDRRLVSADPVLSLTMIGWIEAKIKGHVTCETCHKIIQQRVPPKHGATLWGGTPVSQRVLSTTPKCPPFWGVETIILQHLPGGYELWVPKVITTITRTSTTTYTMTSTTSSTATSTSTTSMTRHLADLWLRTFTEAVSKWSFFQTSEGVKLTWKRLETYVTFQKGHPVALVQVPRPLQASQQQWLTKIKPSTRPMKQTRGNLQSWASRCDLDNYIMSYIFFIFIYHIHIS